MKKKSIFNCLILILLAVYPIIYRLVIYKHFLIYAEEITACFFVILFFGSILFLGFEKSKLTPLKKSVVFSIIITLLCYFAIIYGIGFLTGFLTNSYNLTIKAIFSNTIFTIIIAIASELLRYNFIRSNKDSKILIYIFTILLIILDIVYKINVSDLASSYDIFVFSTVTVLPLIVKNGALSYLAYKIGYAPTLVYRLIFDIYVFVVPITPDLGNYLTASLNVLLPFFIYLYPERIFNAYENKIEHDFESKKFKLSDIPFALFVALLVYLISGVGSYQMLAIGSSSMSPNINKGDAVIVSKLKEDTELKKGDVIAFYRDEYTIVHRIVEVKEDENGNKEYLTKGDYNNGDDGEYITKDDIKGQVFIRIPYIAYPSVIFNEWVN